MTAQMQHARLLVREHARAECHAFACVGFERVEIGGRQFFHDVIPLRWRLFSSAMRSFFERCAVTKLAR
jgi:hypothetical protein